MTPSVVLLKQRSDPVCQVTLKKQSDAALRAYSASSNNTQYNQDSEAMLLELGSGRSEE